jgi:hypothetical protein
VLSVPPVSAASDRSLFNKTLPYRLIHIALLLLKTTLIPSHHHPFSPTKHPSRLINLTHRTLSQQLSCSTLAYVTRT